MSRYKDVLLAKPKLNIKDKANEVIFTLVSCMCDNVSYIRIYKQDEKFRLSHYNSNVGLSFSNLQCRYEIHDILWEADACNWKRVIEMINSGTSVIAEVKSRVREYK